MRDLASNIATKVAIAPAVLSATTDGVAIDTLNFNSVAFAVVVGAIVSDGDFGLEVHESDASDSGFAKIDDSQVNSNAPATLEASSSYKIGVNSFKRFLKLKAVKAGGTSIALGAVAVLGDAADRPVA